MPQHKQAVKRVRQNEKRRQRNNKRRSKMKTLINNVLDENDKEEAEKKLKNATSYLDKMTGKNMIHRNNAARKKSRLTKHVNNL
jgi:small subunit ribosomal protein S20